MPYPTRGHANGLAFAYSGEGGIPLSLVNILKELENDMYQGLKLYQDYGLTSWAKQGVLLINTALTVEEGKPGSHINQWKEFTNYLFKKLGEEKNNIVYICWGNHAKSFIPIFNKNGNNKVIESVHPSPLSANKGGWFGSKPFSKCNQILKELNKDEIKW